MKHPIYRVLSFQIISPYTLKIEFDDSSSQTIYFRPILEGDVYGPLKDLMLFNKVYIDPEVQTLVWPNGADFDPATLHDWQEQLPSLLARAQKWEMAEKDQLQEITKV